MPPDFDQHAFDNATVFCDDVHFLTETERAVLVRFDDGTEEWIAKSQIRDDYTIGETGLLTITTWLAEQKGWWE